MILIVYKKMRWKVIKNWEKYRLLKLEIRLVNIIMEDNRNIFRKLEMKLVCEIKIKIYKIKLF